MDIAFARQARFGPPWIQETGYEARLPLNAAQTPHNAQIPTLRSNCPHIHNWIDVAWSRLTYVTYVSSVLQSCGFGLVCYLSSTSSGAKTFHADGRRTNSSRFQLQPSAVGNMINQLSFSGPMKKKIKKNKEIKKKLRGKERALVLDHRADWSIIRNSSLYTNWIATHALWW